MFITGYAAAAQPIGRAPTPTPATGLVTGEVRVTARDGHRLPAYLARPGHSRPGPALVVIHETFGIHEYIKNVCRRLAHLGYVAIAPDYYDRAGDAAVLPDWDSIRPIVAATPSTQVLDDTAAILDWLETQAFTAAGRFAVVGFCWGGAMAWLACAAEPRFRTGIAWYGLLEVPSYGQPPAALDVAPRLRRPVLGLYGGRDALVPMAVVDRMRSVLPSSGPGAGSRIMLFEEAGHGFHADYRSTYHRASAEAAWNQMIAWLAAHGMRPRG